MCTCVSTESFTCGDEGHGGFACVDPNASCVDDDDVTTVLPSTYYTSSTTSGYTSAFACYTGWLADGLCDLVNNNEDCGMSDIR